MKAYICGIGLALALVAGADPVRAQDKQAPYKFNKGDVLKYDVVGDLQISLKGSHPDFIVGGIDSPLKMNYRVEFENVVLEVAESDGSAQMERRVRTLSAKGEYQGQAFKFDWDRDKDKDKAGDGDDGPGMMIGLFRSWCTSPLKFSVDAEGNYTPSNPNFDRLVMRAGMMYWPVKADAKTKTWVTEVKLAVPVLHDKITIEFKNDFTKSVTRDNRKLMVIAATPKRKSAEKAEDPSMRGQMSGEIEFTVSGDGNQIEFDTTHRRLHSVRLNLTVKLSGKSPVGGGGEGDVKGEVTFSESQTYKD